MTTKKQLRTAAAFLAATLMTAAAPASPTLQILTPSAGATFAVGTTTTITWIAGDASGYADVYLDKGGVPYAAIAHVPLSDGQSDWEICTCLGDAADYTVRILRSDNAGGTLAASSGTFAVTGSVATPTITVTAPVAGTAIAANAATTITWTSVNPTGAVYIDLLKNGVPYWDIGYEAVATGKFTWTPCGAIGDGADYTIRLRMEGCGPVPEAFSDAFAIQGSLASPAMSVTYPVGGETWTAGTTETITFAYDRAGFVRIDLMKGGAWHACLGVVPVAAPGGQLNWPIGSDIADGGDYAVRLGSYDACGRIVETTSVPFSISNPTWTPPSLALLRPGAGETWVAGTWRYVNWTGANLAGPVSAFLLKDGEWLSSIGYGDAVNGECLWTIPANLPLEPDYQVLVRTAGPGPVTQVVGDLFGLRKLNSDVDGDADVDGEDYGLFADCFAGAGNVVPAACAAADLDADGDVDGVDYGLFASCFNGASRPPACQ